MRIAADIEDKEVRTFLKHIVLLKWWVMFQSINIQGVTGGTDQTSGECSLGQTIPI